MKRAILILAAMTLLAHLLQDLLGALFLSVFFMPLALPFVAAPLLLLMTLVWAGLQWVLQRIVKARPGRPVTSVWVVSFIGMLVVFAAPSWVANQSIRANLETLLADDFNALEGGLDVLTLAVQRPIRGRDQTPRCDGFCLHALLTGEVDRFIVLESPESLVPFHPGSTGIAFWFERRETCPYTEIELSGTDRLIGGPRRDGDTLSAVELVNLRTLSGDCFLSEPAAANEADYVIFENAVAQTNYGHSGQDTNLFADAIYAQRRSVFRRADSSWDEVYRRTGAWVWWLSPPTIEGFLFEFEPNFGVNTRLWRRFDRVNADPNGRSPLDWYPFLTQDLSFSLDLSIVEGGIGLNSLLAEARSYLDSGQPSSAQQIRTIEHAMRRLLARGRERTDDEQELLLLALGNWTVPLSYFLYPSRYRFVQSLSPVQQRRLADVVVSRLHNVAYTQTVSPNEHVFSQVHIDQSNIRVLAGLVNANRTALNGSHLEQLRAITDQAVLNVDAAEAILGYAALGELGVAPLQSVLRQLIEWPAIQEDYEQPWGLPLNNSRYEAPARPSFNRAVQALCILGSTASPAMVDLLAMLRSAELGDTLSANRTWIAAVMRMGMDEEAVWRFLNEQRSFEREIFDRFLASFDAKSLEACPRN